MNSKKIYIILFLIIILSIGIFAGTKYYINSKSNIDSDSKIKYNNDLNDKTSSVASPPEQKKEERKITLKEYVKEQQQKAYKNQKYIYKLSEFKDFDKIIYKDFLEGTKDQKIKTVLLKNGLNIEEGTSFFYYNKIGFIDNNIIIGNIGNNKFNNIDKFSSMGKITNIVYIDPSKIEGALEEDIAIGPYVIINYESGLVVTKTIVDLNKEGYRYDDKTKSIVSNTKENDINKIYIDQRYIIDPDLASKKYKDFLKESLKGEINETKKNTIKNVEIKDDYIIITPKTNINYIIFSNKKDKRLYYVDAKIAKDTNIKINKNQLFKILFKDIEQKQKKLYMFTYNENYIEDPMAKNAEDVFRTIKTIDKKYILNID